VYTQAGGRKGKHNSLGINTICKERRVKIKERGIYGTG